jgi:putative DNA primase/helicase
MQSIREDGSKRFAKNSRKEVCFPVVGGLDALAKAPARSSARAMPPPAACRKRSALQPVAAFDSGNLVPVAKALHEKYPDKPMVIAGDDDKHLEATQGVNPGRSKAEEAAKAVGGKRAANPKSPFIPVSMRVHGAGQGTCCATCLTRRTCTVRASSRTR